MMRNRFFTSLATVFAAAAFFSCSKADLEQVDPVIDEGGAAKTYTLTIKASKDDATRALILDGKTLKAEWRKGDKVDVQLVSENYLSVGTLVAQDDGPAVMLSGTVQGNKIYKGSELRLQYNYRKPSGGYYYQSKGTLEDIAATYDYARATVHVGSKDDSGNVITISESSAEFKNQQAIVKFTLTDKDTGKPVNPTTFSINWLKDFYKGGPSGEVLANVVNIPAETYKTNGNGVLYVAMPASNVRIYLRAIIGSQEYLYITNSEKNFEAGKYYEISVKMSDVLFSQATDLSLVDCAGDERTDGRWTANSYMVHTAGTYCIPLVYGNAIKAGDTNAGAYTGVAGEMTTRNFFNHQGNPIKSPWIKDHGITIKEGDPNNVVLLWQDAKGLVTPEYAFNNYLIFTVNKDATEQEGNAVIAVRDEDGDIAWSWHIWVTKQTFSDLVECEMSSHIFKIAPVNVGWVGEAVGTGYCPYYQWGRKDPFLPADTGTGNAVTAYVGNSETENAITIMKTGEDLSFAYLIKNPTVLSYYKMLSDDQRYFNLWDASQTDGDSYGTAGAVKTVYDPCPPGFCVPTGFMYKAIDQVGYDNPNFAYDSANKGRLWSFSSPSLFFPACGHITDKYYNVGSSVRYWVATGHRYILYKSVYEGLQFEINPTWVYNLVEQREVACPIRPVAEE